jgi:uncharacterized protein (TIGR02246 family)
MMSALTPEECDELFARHLNEGDLERLVALYEPEASLVQRDGAVVSGQEAIRAHLQKLVALRPRISASVTKVVPAGADLAAVYNDWTMQAKAPDGAPITRSGKAIELVRRRLDGSWLFVIDDPFARG